MQYVPARVQRWAKVFLLCQIQTRANASFLQIFPYFPQAGHRYIVLVLCGVDMFRGVKILMIWRRYWFSQHFSRMHRKRPISTSRRKYRHEISRIEEHRICPLRFHASYTATQFMDGEMAGDLRAWCVTVTWMAKYNAMRAVNNWWAVARVASSRP